MSNDVIINVKLQDIASAELKKLQGEFSGFQKNVVSLGASFYALQVAWSKINEVFAKFSDLINTTAEFERIGVALKTVAGSAQKAKESLTWIEEFSAKTPYSLQQVSESFTRLKSIGIKDVQGELAFLGDTASAFGKDLSTAVDAFTGVLVGRTVMLKQFGITVNQIGEQMTFNWAENGKAMSKTIGKNRDEIIELLHSITGKYKGAMVDLMLTFTGIFSNLEDQFNLFKKSLAEVAVFQDVKAMFLGLSNTIDSLRKNEAFLQKLSSVIQFTLDVTKLLGGAFVVVSAVIADTFSLIMGLENILENTFQTVRKIIIKTFQRIAIEVKIIFYDMLETIRSILKLVPIIGKNIDTVLISHEKTIQELKNKSVQNIKEIQDSWKSYKNTFKDEFVFTETAIKLYYEYADAINTVGNAFDKLTREQNAKSTAKSLSEADKAIFDNLERSIQAHDGYETLTGKIKKLFNSMQGFKDNLKNVFEVQGGIFQSIFGLKDINVSFGNLNKALTDNFESVLTGIKKQRDSVIAIMKSYVSAITSVDVFLKRSFQEKEDTLQRFGESIKRFFPSAGIISNLLNTKTDENTNKLIATTYAIGKANEEAVKLMFGFASVGESAGIMGEKVKEEFNYMANIAKDTATAMNTFFSDFFFDAFKGNLDSLSDYFNNFLDSILRSLSNSLAQNVTSGLMGSLSGAFGFNPNNPPSGSTTYTQASAGIISSSAVGGNVASRAKNSMTAFPVYVNIENKSNSQVGVQSVDFDMKSQVINIIVEDALNGGKTARIFGR